MARFDRFQKQARTGKTTWSAIVGSAAFQLGVRDFQKSLPFREAVDIYRMFPGVRGAVWNYERGRLYAAACAGRSEDTLPSRIGRYVNRSLIVQFAAMYYQKEVL